VTASSRYRSIRSIDWSYGVGSPVDAGNGPRGDGKTKEGHVSDIVAQALWWLEDEDTLHACAPAGQTMCFELSAGT
jgi:hypothetical protein